MYNGIAGKAMVSKKYCSGMAGNWGCSIVRPRTNSCMLRDPGVESATGRANVARRRSSIYILHRSQSTREVVFVKRSLH